MKKLKISEGIKKFTTVETILLVIISLFVGLCMGGLLSKTNVVSKTETTNDKNLKEFITNYEYILNNYYEKVDKKLLINSAIAGMMDSLGDPYSMYFDEDATNNFTITLDGSYSGIGVQISKEEETGYIIIGAIFKDSPAAEAGLELGDKIVSIDNKKSAGYTLSEFSSLIKDSDNELFELKILRDNEEKNIKLKKRVVELASVTSKMFNENGKKIGYIYIGIFANNTCDQFEQELNKLEKQNIDALIIDVRGNSGGHLTSAEGILDIFLNSNQIMYQFEQSSKKSPTYATGKGNKKYEISLLGDESSASASEVLIAGLRENLGSKFIGKKTYGKGTVQELVTLSDGTQYKITTKKWLTPKGNWINDTKGIDPDMVIELDDKYFTKYDDLDDTQLQAALNYISNK